VSNQTGITPKLPANTTTATPPRTTPPPNLNTSISDLPNRLGRPLYYSTCFAIGAVGISCAAWLGAKASLMRSVTKMNYAAARARNVATKRSLPPIYRKKSTLGFDIERRLMFAEFMDALNRFSAEELRMYGLMAALGGSGEGKFLWPWLPTEIEEAKASLKHGMHKC
jgi:hypothetical protein